MSSNHVRGAAVLHFCGRSYDFKLCPHRQPQSPQCRNLSSCGFRELSTPHPRIPFWLAPLIALLSALPGLLLLAITILFSSP